MRFLPAILVVLSPDLALACPLCIAAREESRLAFLATTGLLTFLPLMMIGGLIWWVKRRYQEAEADPIERIFGDRSD